MWAVYALLSAAFAAATSILAKIGMDGINSNLATAIRTVVVLVMAWGIVLVTGKHHGIGEISQKGWLFLALSGLATGLSWFFYFRALQLGDASKVVPVDKFSVVLSMAMAYFILHEAITLKTAIGGLLITAGTLALVF
jgi:transporter family protein